MTLIPVVQPSSSARSTYGARSMPEDIVVGASPFVLQNTNDFGVRVFIIGGDLTDVEFQSQPWDPSVWYSCGTVRTLVLNSGDSIRVTYGAGAPTMAWSAF